MPIYDFKCNNCGNIKEFVTGSTIKTQKELCKNCKIGIYEKIDFTIPNNISSDVIGGYDYQYGKKAKLKDPKHKANYLTDPSTNPY